MDSLLLGFGAMRLEWHDVLLSLLVAFLCSSAIATCYERTFVGLSWSRNLLHTMVLGSMVAALVMIAIGDSVARGIGIIGSLALIRFRTNLRDPRDLVFLFGAMGAGVASGVRSYSAAVIGTALLCAVAFGLRATRFGDRRGHDGLVRFQLPSLDEASAAVATVMRAGCAHFALVTMRPVAQGEMVDYAYQVKLSAPGGEQRLLAGLRQLAGIRGLTYVDQTTTEEL